MDAVVGEDERVCVSSEEDDDVDGEPNGCMGLATLFLAARISPALRAGGGK